MWLMTAIALLIIPQITLAGTIKGKVSASGLRVPEDVVVYITKVSDTKPDLSGAKFVLDQKYLSFVPHVLVIPVGSTVDFPNDDKVEHNVFSLSRTKPFNLGNYGPGLSKKVTFDQPGLVELRCDMHAEMAGFILVLDNIYFGITDKNGNFSILDDNYLKQYGIQKVKELPAGQYEVRTWHEKLKSGKETVTVPAKGEVKLELNLRRGTPGRLF